MYVGLFVRDEYERLVKNKFQKMNQRNSWLACEKQPVKRPCVEHDWKLKSHARLWISWVFREKGQPTKYPWNCLFGKKLCCFTISFTHTIYPHYPWIVRSAIQRVNPSKYTWELEIVIPTIIYTFPYGFPQTPTFPSLDPWKVFSPNTYHTYSEW